MAKKEKKPFDDDDDEFEEDYLDDNELEVNVTVRYATEEGSMVRFSTEVIVDTFKPAEARERLRMVTKLFQESVALEALKDHELSMGKGGELHLVPADGSAPTVIKGTRRKRTTKRKRNRGGGGGDGPKETPPSD